jgi:hypothetical protein
MDGRPAGSGSNPARSHSAARVATETPGSGSNRGEAGRRSCKLGARGVSISIPPLLDAWAVSGLTLLPLRAAAFDPEPSDARGVGPTGVALADILVTEIASRLCVGLRDRAVSSLSGSDEAIDLARNSRSAASLRACLISLSSRRCLARSEGVGRGAASSASRIGSARGLAKRSRLSRPREPELCRRWFPALVARFPALWARRVCTRGGRLSACVVEGWPTTGRATAGMAIAVVRPTAGAVSPDPPDGSLVEYDKSFWLELAMVVGLFLCRGK